ncbi:MAG: redoxin domain-containing protein, partial [Bacteroidales bacterium]|nr:redoxin domain-containing protein [Bacteroidales bacterium]
MNLRNIGRLFAFAFLMFVCLEVNAQYKEYKVKLWIHDFADSVIYLKGAFGEKNNLLLDSLKMKSDGSFEVIGKQHPGIVVVSSAKEDMFSFVLDKETEFTLSIFPDGFYEVKGSIENDRYLEYQKMNKDYRKVLYEGKLAIKNQPEKQDSIQSVMLKARKEFTDYQNAFYKNYPENIMSVLVRAISQPDMPKKYFDEKGEVKKETGLEYAYVYRKHYWDGFDFRDSRIMGTPYFYKKFQTYLDKLTMQNADSVFASFKYFVDLANSRGGELYSDYIIDLYLSKLPRLPFSFNEVLYTKIVDSLINDKYTPWMPLNEREFHQVKIDEIRNFLPGKPFPNISAQTMENRNLQLYDLKKRYTVVFFWSAGCESCKKNIDELKEFYNSSKEKYDFEVFSIEMGGNLEETKKQLEQEKFK